jgi:hypothetical protein
MAQTIGGDAVSVATSLLKGIEDPHIVDTTPALDSKIDEVRSRRIGRSWP